jgi:hypothetical protein
MASFKNTIIAILAGEKPELCTEACKYYMFPHRDNACVLSDVFSTKKYRPCYQFEPKEQEND